MRILAGLSLVAAASVATVLIASACSSSDENGGTGTKDSGSDTGGDDGSANDAGTDPDADGIGKLGSGTLAGMTLDDVALVADKGANAYYPMSVTNAGKVVVQVALCPVTGSVVAYGARAMTCVASTGAFSVWTAQNGPIKLATTAAGSAGPVNDVLSPDVQQIVYATNVVTGTPSTGNLVVNSVNGKGTPTTLATGVKLTTSLQVKWINKILVIATDVGADGSAAVDVASYDSEKAFAKKSLATNVASMTTYGNSAVVAVVSQAGALGTISTDGGAVAPLDTNVTRTDMLYDGRTIFYGTTGGALKRVDSSTDAGAQTLVDGGFTDRGVPIARINPRTPMGVSPNGAILVQTDPDLTYALITGATPNVLPTLAAGTQALDGDLFTQDGKYFIYNSATASFAAPTAGGLPKEVDPGTSRTFKWAIDKSRIVYAADGAIKQVDLDDPTAPKPVLSGVAAPMFFLTSAKNKIVYTAGANPDDPAAAVTVALVPPLQ